MVFTDENVAEMMAGWLTAKTGREHRVIEFGNEFVLCVQEVLI